MTQLENSKRTISRKIISRIWNYYAKFRWGRNFKKFGIGSSIGKPLLLTGQQQVEIGKNVSIWTMARIEALNIAAAKTRIKIGDDTVIQPFVHIGAVDSIEVGSECLFASHVYITDHDHEWRDINVSPRKSQNVISSPVKIGDQVWLGERVMVLKGVTIGDRAIVGAGAIVTSDIPAYSVAVGSPAKVVKTWCAADERWVQV